MKRISKGRNSFLSRRAWKNWLVFVNRRKLKGDNVARKWVEDRITPPSIFSFSRNYSETVECLQKLKNAALLTLPHERKRAFLDLEPIQEMSVAGALVLAAEMDRWRLIRRANLKPRNLKKWSPRVKRVLHSLGFFELLGISVKEDTSGFDIETEITVIPLVSSASVKGELFSKISNYMAEIAKIFRQDPSVYGALTEAAYNSTLHAYPTDYTFRYPVLEKRWWATCSYDPRANTVKFLVYDQGVGISETLPRWSHWEKVRSGLMNLPFVGDVIGGAVNDSSHLIEAAIDVSRTSMSGGHGKGLKDVVAPVELIPGTKVRLLSGKGMILYTSDGVVERRDESLHIGGTLIEWTIPAGIIPEEVTR